MRIVLVEDNQTLLKSITKVLIDEGHTVQAFSDGESAYKWLMVEHQNVDVGIFDYMLPGMSGVELLQELREDEVVIPVLMLTARDGVTDKVAGLDAGADYYLTKPFEYDELLACLKVLYRRPQTYQTESIELREGIVCNLGSRTVNVDGKEAKLTPTEFSILEYMIRHRGEVVSQQQIYEHVFDFAKENWSNTIEVHIKNLRKKLHTPKYEDIITTIRGAGYSLEG